MVKSTPDWANGGQGVLVAPNDPKDYADFMFAASRRYPSVKRWMIWGEPNYGYNFQPMPPNSPVGPRLYAQVLDAAYGALKDADKNNIVIGGMTLNSLRNIPTPDFIRYLRLGTGKKARPPRVDWWGHNPFEARYPNIALNPGGKFRGLNDVDTLHKELKRAYVGKKKEEEKEEEGEARRHVGEEEEEEEEEEAPAHDAEDLALGVDGALRPPEQRFHRPLRLAPGAGQLAERRLRHGRQDPLRAGPGLVPPRRPAQRHRQRGLGPDDVRG